MLSQEYKKILNEAGKTSYGVALKAFLDDKFADIGDIKTCKSWEETLGRQHALNLLKELYVLMEEKKTGERGKNQYI